MRLDNPTRVGILGTMNATEVRELRQRLGMTQAAFSKRLGVTTRTVERWEGGKVIPKGLALAALQRLQKQAERKEPR